MNQLSINALLAARLMILLELVTIAASTAAASVIEALIFLIFLGSRHLRKRVLHTLRQPMVIMTLVVFSIVGLGVIYSEAPLHDALNTWGSWRKCLILPLAAAVYDDSSWKRIFLWVLIGLMTLAATMSFIGKFLSFSYYHKLDIGIVVHNWAAQSMLLAAAAFGCMIMLIFHRAKYIGLLIPCASLLITNLIFVTWGRSGYLAFLIYLILIVYWTTKGWLRLSMLLAATLILSFTLLLSPVARNTLQTGLTEIHTYQTNRSETSMGIRAIFWTNTFHILEKMEKPLLGYGTSGFKIPYAEQVKGQTGWQATVTNDPHNQYLKILIEHGVVGLVVFLLFIGSFFRQRVPPPYYYLGIGILWAWSATSLFSGHFSTFFEGRIFFLWSGVMLSPLPNINADCGKAG